MNQNNTPEPETFELNAQYSTTRRVTQTQPVIANKPEDKIHSVLFLADNPERKAEGGLRTQGYFKHHHADKPLISVITVVFNGAEHLEQTINSVIGQTYDNVEYIIIDGGSTDGTLAIIRKYEGQIDYWVSEPDGGISDAFNKGISLCTGEIIGIINADDWYENGIFNDISLHTKYDVLHGQLQYWKANLKMELFEPNQGKLDKEMTLNHPTCFVRHNMYKLFGGFNDELKIAMDYDFLLRVKSHNASFFYLPALVAHMRYLGVSDINWTSTYKEAFKVKVANGKSIYLSTAYLGYQILRRYIRVFLEKIGLRFIIHIYRSNFSIMPKS